jgi:hypothetical protein
MRKATLLNSLRVYLISHVERGTIVRVPRRALAEKLHADEQELIAALGLLRATGGANFRTEKDGTLVLSRDVFSLTPSEREAPTRQRVKSGD